MVTKGQLDTALAAWEVARETSFLQQQALGTLLQSHRALTESLRQYGHTWADANAEFINLSQAHSDSLLAAWKALDERLREYRELLKQYERQ
jgi:hypothetical protein